MAFIDGNRGYASSIDGRMVCVGVNGIPNNEGLDRSLYMLFEIETWQKRIGWKDLEYAGQLTDLLDRYKVHHWKQVPRKELLQTLFETDEMYKNMLPELDKSLQEDVQEIIDVEKELLLKRLEDLPLGEYVMGFIGWKVGMVTNQYKPIFSQL
jgi:hypothetical protein